MCFWRFCTNPLQKNLSFKGLKVQKKKIENRKIRDEPYCHIDSIEKKGYFV